ncbi:MAG: hypothetical protein WCE75_08430, partial [Terracidiphilus sp.]
MRRSIVLCAALLAATALLGAQEPGSTNPYEGTSNPPSDDNIVTTPTPHPKPRPGRYPGQQQQPLQQTQATQQPVQPQYQPLPQGQPQSQPRDQSQAEESDQPGGAPTSVDPSVNFPDPDAGIVQPRRRAGPADSNYPRADFADPDGDIVHPHPLRPGELGEGTTIRVRLLNRLSSGSAQRGESFRCRVATDVVRDGQVIIPAGSEIDGHVVMTSRGQFAGHGEMRLRPEVIVMNDGLRYRFSAQVTGTPGSHDRVGREGVISPGSRTKRDAIEIGGGVGAGAATGALLG